MLSVLALSMLGPTTSPGPEIRWRSDPGCVATEPLGPRIAALLNDAAPPATLELTATREADQWRVGLGIRSDAHSFDRTLTGRDCATITEAVALIVAVQLDPVTLAHTVVTGEPNATPADPVTTNAARSVPPPSSAAPTSTTTERLGVTSSPAPSVAPSPDERPPLRSRARAVLGAAVAGELGVLPRGAIAVEVSAGMQWPRARVELGGLASAGPDAMAAAQPSVGGRFQLLTGLLRGCGLAGHARWQLPLCAGAELGDLRAAGTGLSQPATVDALWLAMVASARLQWMLRPRLAVGALLDLVAPLRRHRFSAAEAGLVHAIDPVAARLGLRVELQLP